MFMGTVKVLLGVSGWRLGDLLLRNLQGVWRLHFILKGLKVWGLRGFSGPMRDLYGPTEGSIRAWACCLCFEGSGLLKFRACEL